MTNAEHEPLAASLEPTRSRPREQGSSTPARVGPYRVLQLIGKGGMGVVYKAEHVHLGRLVALKLLPVENARDPELLGRFLNEMKAIGRLGHPNLVSATDAGEANGQYFLAMELLDGLNLATLSRLCGQLTVADACELIRQAAIGLHCMHEMGLFHRDVKPSNLFLTTDGVTKVLDLGLAHLRQGSAAVQDLTGSGVMLGTGDFMAPEQGENAHHIDRRADIYSLGCSLYKLLTGKAPFEDHAYDTLLKKVLAHGHTPIPPIGERRADLSAELVVLIDRLLAKSPDDRPADCAAVVEALTPFAQGADVLALLAQGRVKQAAEPPAPMLAPIPTVQEDTKQQSRESTDSVSKALVPAVQPGRRWWLWAFPVVVVLLGIVAWSQWPALIPFKKDDAPVGPPKLVAGEWVPLLRFEPTKIEWPTSELDLQYQLNRDKERLSITTNRRVMLQFVDAPEGSYQVVVKVRQPTWTGRWGVYFLRHEDFSTGKREIRCRSIELLPYKDDRAEAFAFHYNDVTEVDRQVQSRRMGFHAIRVPEDRQYSLGFKIVNGRLRQVVWDNLVLTDLIAQEDDRPAGSDNLGGGIGIMVQSASISFEKLEVQLNERKR